MQQTHTNKTGKSNLDRRFATGMRLNPMRKEFQVFSAVYREKSISKASEYLQADQGNISKTLKSLETKSKTKLFHRHRFGVKPTPAADELNLVLTEITGIWQKLHTGDYSLRTPMVIRIGAHKMAAQAYAGKILSFIEDNFSNCFTEINLDSSMEVIRSVQKREIELGIVANPPKSTDMIIRRLIDQEVFHCGREDADEDNVLLINPYLVEGENFFNQRNFARVMHIFDYDVAASIASTDKRYTCIVPASVVERYEKLKPLNDVKVKFELKLITYPGSPAAGWLGKLASNIAGEDCL